MRNKQTHSTFTLLFFTTAGQKRVCNSLNSFRAKIRDMRLMAFFLYCLTKMCTREKMKKARNTRRRRRKVKYLECGECKTVFPSKSRGPAKVLCQTNLALLTKLPQQLTFLSFFLVFFYSLFLQQNPLKIDVMAKYYVLCVLRDFKPTSQNENLLRLYECSKIENAHLFYKSIIIIIFFFRSNCCWW